ncbi:MAG: PhoH family protein [Firmicutes bacterium]|nr:PhoH family protein [Bacillota bacterium]
MSDTQIKIDIPTNHLMADLLGDRDELLRLIEDSFKETSIHVRGNRITIDGKEKDLATKVFNELLLIAEHGQKLDKTNVKQAIEMVLENIRPSVVLDTEILRTPQGRSVRPKTQGQKNYVDAIKSNTVTFGIGPAGTGKSYLAVALAIKALQDKQVTRIVLTRPAVEAGERLGFLPGDLMAKVDPYLRPLYDALYEMLDPDGAQKLIDRGIVEVAPLAFMRGRTLNSSFIILDEAQNTTPEQMKMFLTRIGFNSKAVVTGDVTQIDVVNNRSGLLGLEDILQGVNGITFVKMNNKDVVRAQIVRDIVSAYEQFTYADNQLKRQ